MLTNIIAWIIIGGGCIDGAPCFQTANDGTIHVPNRREKKANPTIVIDVPKCAFPGQAC
jgi:hypothetical protein